MHAEYMIKGLIHCQFSSKLIIPFSEKLQVCPKLLAEKLLHRVEQLPIKYSDPTIKLNFFNSALSKCENITPEFKERIALKIGVVASAIQQKQRV